MGVQEQYRDYVMTGFVKRVEPVVADHGDGAYLYDADGREYIDCFAGITVMNAGHYNQEVVDAAIAQVDRLVHCCSYVYYAEPVGALAEMLAAGTPGLEEDVLRQRRRGGDRGRASAGEALQRQERGRLASSRVFTAVLGRARVTGNSGRKKGAAHTRRVSPSRRHAVQYRASPRHRRRRSATCGARARVGEMLRFCTSGSVAAFIAEPVIGEGGIIVPPATTSSGEGDSRRAGILFIADEVQSGFGRTGACSPSSTTASTPDII